MYCTCTSNGGIKCVWTWNRNSPYSHSSLLGRKFYVGCGCCCEILDSFHIRKIQVYLREYVPITPKKCIVLETTYSSIPVNSVLFLNWYCRQMGADGIGDWWSTGGRCWPCHVCKLSHKLLWVCVLLHICFFLFSKQPSTTPLLPSWIGLSLSKAQRLL